MISSCTTTNINKKSSIAVSEKISEAKPEKSSDNFENVKIMHRKDTGCEKFTTNKVPQNNEKIDSFVISGCDNITVYECQEGVCAKDFTKDLRNSAPQWWSKFYLGCLNESTEEEKNIYQNRLKVFCGCIASAVGGKCITERANSEAQILACLVTIDNNQEFENAKICEKNTKANFITNPYLPKDEKAEKKEKWQIGFENCLERITPSQKEKLGNNVNNYCGCLSTVVAQQCYASSNNLDQTTFESCYNKIKITELNIDVNICTIRNEKNKVENPFISKNGFIALTLKDKEFAKSIVGSWKEGNTITIFNPQGTYTIKYFEDNEYKKIKQEETGRWQIKNSRLKKFRQSPKPAQDKPLEYIETINENEIIFIDSYGDEYKKIR